MESIKQQPKNFIKSLQIIHIVMLVGVLIFAAYVVLNGVNKLFFTYEDGKAFLYLAIIISFVGNLASKSLYQKLIKEIKEDMNFELKISKFATAHLFRLAMLEFPAFMCIIFVMQSNNSFFFILAGILFFMMLVIYPTKFKFENDVPLSSSDKSMLEKL